MLRRSTFQGLNKWSQILEILLQPTRDLHLGKRFNFQQDNDSKHMVKATKRRFKSNWKNWDDLKIAIHWGSSSNVSKLKQILHGGMGKDFKIKMCKARSDISQSLRVNAVIATYKEFAESKQNENLEKYSMSEKGLSFFPKKIFASFLDLCSCRIYFNALKWYGVTG